MSFLKALLTVVAMGVVLTIGLILTMAGKPWLLILGAVVFVVMFSKYGCLTH